MLKEKCLRTVESYNNINRLETGDNQSEVADYNALRFVLEFGT